MEIKLILNLKKRYLELLNDRIDKDNKSAYGRKQLYILSNEIFDEIINENSTRKGGKK